MYRFDILFCIIIAQISIIHACPTCIGLPKTGTRPYFENHGIRHQEQTIFLHKNTQNKNLPSLSSLYKQSPPLPTHSITKPTD